MKNEVLDKAMTGIMNRTVLFTNFTDKPLKVSWDSQEFNFKPGESRYMEYWRARHFAKHLVNQELADPAKYPMGASSQSPKDELGVFKDPLFQSLFVKALKEQDELDVKAPEPSEIIDNDVRNGVDEKASETKEVLGSEEDEEEFGGIKGV